MKQFVRAALASVLVTTPVLSMAAGTIKFTGTVTDQTCKVNVGGEKDHVVKLPTVSKSQLAVAGATAGITPFKIFVTDCTPAGTDIAINTVFSGATLTDNQNLQNAGTAGNVEVQLLTGAGAGDQVIPLTSVTHVAGLSVATGQTGAEYEFAARYFAAGAATAGSVEATVNYDITYN